MKSKYGEQTNEICGIILNLKNERVAICNRKKQHKGSHTAYFLDGSTLKWTQKK